jgi:hypothetical protein
VSIVSLGKSLSPFPFSAELGPQLDVLHKDIHTRLMPWLH